MTEELTPKAEEIFETQAEPEPNLASFWKKDLTKKQILLSLGCFLLLITSVFGLYLYQVQKTKPNISQPQPATSIYLTLSSPTENSIITDSEITIKGSTLPNIPVVFYTENADDSVESDENGNFEGKINLSEGINTLTVTAFGDNDEEKTLAYNLVYDNQVKGVKDAPGQSKKDETEKKAVVGNVETVTANSVITEKNNKRTETEVDKNTKIINQNKKTLKLNSLKKNDLTAIITEDETATGSTKLKKAMRIYVRDATSSAQAQSKRKAVSGIIQSISGNLIILTHQIQTDRVFQFYFNNQTYIKIKDIPKATVADLKAGQRIAAVGDYNEENQLVAKRIHVIQGKATGVFNKYPSTATPSGALNISPTATPSGTITITPTEEPTSSPTPTIEITTTP